jgi:preprotein translocase subunit YajC
MEALFPLILTFGLMWVLLIRPQQRRVREHQAVVASLVEGDEVISTGGLIGTIEEINEDVLSVEVAPGVQIKMLRSAVQTRIGGPDDADPDELAEEFDSEDVEETADLAEPAPLELETAAVEELPPASSGELPPAGSGSTTTTMADPTADNVPPRRPDGGSGGS